jgi:hypothetical protein
MAEDMAGIDAETLRRIEEYTDKLVAKAPPLSDEQQAVIDELLGINS